MGANQSHHARQPEEDRRPTLRRRISTFLRRDQENQNASKRERSNSAQNSLNSPGPKRRRVDGDDEQDGDDHMSEPVAGPSRLPANPSVPFPRTMPSSGISTPASPDTPASPATDEMLSDRLRSVSTIRDGLGPDWTPQSGLMSRFRRRDSPAVSTAASTSSVAPPAATIPARTLSHRLSAIMGFAAPERSPPSTSIPSSSSPQPHTPANEASPPPEDEGRIPVGAVLVIQGLAQTHANLDETGGPNPQVDLTSLDQQARMIGNLLTVAAAATATTLLSPESLSTQPSRSTAQTAMQTIIERLRPQRNSRNHQSVEAALGEYLRTVLRDNRRFAEAVAGDTPNAANVPAEFQDFLHMLQEDLIDAVRAYAVPDAAGDDEEDVDEDAEVPAAAIPPSTVEEASSGPSSATDLDTEATPTTTAPASISTATTQPVSPTIPTFHRQRGQNLPGTVRRLGVSGGADGTPRRLNFFRAHLFPTVHVDGSVATPNLSEEQEEAIVPSIFVGVRSIAHSPNMTTEDLVAHPSFPFMDGQVPEDAAAGTTATDSSSATSPVAEAHSLPEDDHDFDRDLEQELASAAAASSSGDVDRPRRSLRSRVLERLGASRREPRASPPLNTYLIYVIGGNYPRSHPVLSIPSLVSGGPLTAEDLQLLSELLGPAKPPTVTQEEIEASGLKVIKADTLTQAVQDGEVLDASTERCMVCLCDYEDDDVCRVLKCRHAFHMPCVDQWLTSGRNSCPTCRTDAVDKNAVPPPPEVEDADAVA
ncbi:hypothetical protein CcaverHIS002_0502930 [Cutaneotrichosporon cavernicola]|uniref:RING-type domain-containing protein n=1 Tax=Cutaneotrichosporon cavernicola TaxID=279322 RepID=A0AA48L6A6_9TREE|nr:uncharacterized protein CcaverHIS019_0503500 [Cutaneotrichosporon cavernicola]BEI84892.1 hypothetical protein CcaverHIS002_0502930 [Cutaneotrichosporon cavernicola]BEI92722.1 hypothetical protein CcaverHIS019_0503500 [Cutaneotrichosporon cavernicola]BEJ00499.1 hypothetical protein CcaverHIS631_0503560 [Cutaneotrichosporon cavernicola]BEJ08268.1 hypothetical protein CcaverHIS641_0503530 [Cutaneotrichosporon cavernicola]